MKRSNREGADKKAGHATRSLPVHEWPIADREAFEDPPNPPPQGGGNGGERREKRRGATNKKTGGMRLPCKVRLARLAERKRYFLID
jgi:hypothetical protein